MGKCFKRDELKNELKRIKENNSLLNENIIFKNSLFYRKETNFTLTPQELNYKKENKKEKFLFNPIKMDLTRRQTKELKNFMVKHFVKIKELEKWRKSKKNSQQAFNDDYIIRNFTNFEENKKEFNELIKNLEIQEKLIKKGFIDKFTYEIFTKSLKQSRTDYNKKYYDENNKYWLSDNKEIEKILWDNDRRKQFLLESLGLEKTRLSDKLVIELLMRGDQEIEIFYQEFEVDITDKGLEYLNNNWLQKNLTKIISISAILISFTTLILNIFKVI